MENRDMFFTNFNKFINKNGSEQKEKDENQNSNVDHQDNPNNEWLQEYELIYLSYTIEK